MDAKELNDTIQKGNGKGKGKGKGRDAKHLAKVNRRGQPTSAKAQAVPSSKAYAIGAVSMDIGPTSARTKMPISLKKASENSTNLSGHKPRTRNVEKTIGHKPRMTPVIQFYVDPTNILGRPDFNLGYFHVVDLLDPKSGTPAPQSTPHHHHGLKTSPQES